MENIIIPPTSDINKACDLLEKLIPSFSESMDTTSNFGKYEAPVECLNLMQLMSRNLEAIILMARHDLVLFPSAIHLVRSSFEITMKILWMLEPSEEFEREVRWLAQLQTEVSFLDRSSKRLREIEADDSDAIKDRDQISDLMNEVIKELPKPYKPLSTIPNLDEMMKTIGEREKYLTYMYLSQYSHGTHVATRLYRRGLGVGKELGEYIRPENWRAVFTLCWYCFAKSGNRFLEVLGGDVNKFYTNDFTQEIEATILNIKNT